MATTLHPAEAVPPGEYLADELMARGWTNVMFAEIIGRPVQVVSEIVNGRKEITAETAAEIGAATGTEAETWLHLQDAFRLWQLRAKRDLEPLKDVVRRGRLADLVPLKELRERGLVSGDLDEQQAQVLDLLGIGSLEETPRLALAARRSVDDVPMSSIQWTWVACVQREIEKVSRPLAVRSLEEMASSLATTIRGPNQISELPACLASAGVILAFVPAFKGSKIDGAALDDDRGPTVAISGRIPKFDSVIFTVLHELAHLHLGHVVDGLTLDDSLDSEPVVVRERAADALATDWALGPRFRTPGVLSRTSVMACADRLDIHPSIVVGRLHHAGVLPWTHLNNLVPNVRVELDALSSHANFNGR